MAGETAPRGVVCVETDIPAGVTIARWRRRRAAATALRRRPWAAAFGRERTPRSRGGGGKPCCREPHGWPDGVDS